MFLENKSLMLGVDIGGSHITASLIDMNNECTFSQSRIRNSVNTHGTADEILDVWVSTIEKVIDGYSPNKINVSIAMPGPFDYENGISLIKGMNKYESLYEIDILAHLSSALGIHREKILFRNDAEAFLHGEANCGVAKGYQSAIGITLGTGLGSAIHREGQTTDANIGVSEFKDGIAEDYISTRWFVKRYAELSSGKVKDARELLGLVDKDLIANQILVEFIDNLSDFLYSFIKQEGPEVVVIGGNIARGYEYFLNELSAKLVKRDCDVPVRITELWEDAAMIGAACYWKSSIFGG